MATHTLVISIILHQITLPIYNCKATCNNYYYTSTAGYQVTRPAVARVINEDNYNSGVVRYVNNGSVVFVAGESNSTLWPGVMIAT